jgi:hypothetical protein
MIPAAGKEAAGMGLSDDLRKRVVEAVGRMNAPSAQLCLRWVFFCKAKPAKCLFGMATSAIAPFSLPGFAT